MFKMMKIRFKKKMDYKRKLKEQKNKEWITKKQKKMI